MNKRPKPLKREDTVLYHYRDGKRIEGANENMSGDCSGLTGDCSGLKGSCTWLSGICTGLWGNCSGLKGSCSGLTGDLDEIPLSARPCNIADWAE
jgi:hypothetical protein